MQHEHLETKTSNLLSFMIGSGIAMLFTFTVFWQQEGYTITEPSYKPIVSDWWIKDTEKWITSEYSSGWATIKLIESKRPRAGWGNQWTEKVVERPIQPILRTGDKKVLVKWFPEDSIATITNTIYYNELWWDWLLTFKGENWTYELTRQSDWINDHGKRERSFGQCQLMEVYHAPFIWKDWYTEIRPWYYKVSNPSWFTDDFLDPVKHANYCVSVYKDAQRKWRLSTTFYAYNHRWKYKNLFTLITE